MLKFECRSFKLILSETPTRDLFLNLAAYLKAIIITLHQFCESFSFGKKGGMIFGKTIRHVPKLFSLYHLLRHTIRKPTKRQHNNKLL